MGKCWTFARVHHQALQGLRDVFKAQENKAVRVGKGGKNAWCMFNECMASIHTGTGEGGRGNVCVAY